MIAKAKTEKWTLSPQRLFLLVLTGWLVPGAGFFWLPRRFWGRGVVFAVLLHVTFLVGMILKGGVVTPGAQGIEPISFLTFIVQLGAGWLALWSYLAYLLSAPLLAPQVAHPLYELGSFYCLVAGTLNIFAVLQAVDRSRKRPIEIMARQ